MKTSKFRLCILYIGLAVLLLFGSISPATATINATHDVNLEEIQNLLYQYFQLRYEARKKNVIPDLSQFVAVNSERANKFLSTETNKLRLEALHVDKNDLEYLDYKFTIDIQSVDVKSQDRTVTVIVLENHEVVFKKTPHIVSKMNNLIHQIVLSPDGQFWKIIDDIYDDYLWRAIRQTSIEFIESQLNTPQSIPFASYPAIQQNKVGSGGYNRSNAVQFARTWYNSTYPGFYRFSADCTNFVSQAINIGGSIPQTATAPGVNVGWYYVNSSQYANAWTFTPAFYDFVVNGHWWVNGPEGVVTVIQQLLPGDVILYDIRTGSQTYDHAVIVVEMTDLGNQELFPLVAGHSPDVNNYPFTAFNYSRTYPIQIIGD